MGGKSSRSPTPSGTQNVITSTALPDWMNRGLSRGASRAETLYGRRDAYPEYPRFDTTAGLGALSLEGLQGLKQMARRGGPPGTAEAFRQYAGTLGDDYLGAGVPDYLSGAAGGGLVGRDVPGALRSMMAGRMVGEDIPAGLSSMAGGGMVGRDISEHLRSMQRGDYLHGGPGFDAALDAAHRRIMPAIDSRFAGSGRFNSGLSDIGMSQALGDAFASQYGDERRNQLAAAQTVQGVKGAQRGQQLGALGALTGALGAQRGQQLGALGQYGDTLAGQRGQALQAGLGTAGLYGDERSRQIAALGLAPGMSALGYDPATRLAGVGGVMDATRQRSLDDEVARYWSDERSDYNRLDDYIRQMTGAAAPGTGTGTSTQSTPLYSNPMAGVLGGAATGAGLAGTLGASLGGAGLAGPWGLGLGALGGGLLGLLG